MVQNLEEFDGMTPLFWKGGTGELAKTKGSDRIFTIKLGLSQSLVVQEGSLTLM